MTGVPESDVVRVRRWCRDRTPEHVRDRVRVEVDVGERHLTIVECRAPLFGTTGEDWIRFPVARLRYMKTRAVWSLYWRDRDARFHAYDLAPPTANIEKLLAEVDRDPTAIFGVDRSGALGRRSPSTGTQVRCDVLGDRYFEDLLNSAPTTDRDRCSRSSRR
ncbi:DUF3024 domain-containing protein [Mycobacterium asiaticum]|uniref:DUF3024 domain-containing protein n=1 Tax=Mycobacterium asiaticum TaxID=1790 RepID=UPI0026499720|nr:DUF3024 domain-containing protein [Mycobacterium asiaticum]